MSENRYEECINLIKLYKRDIIQKAIKRVIMNTITNKMKKRIEELNIDEEKILNEPKPITLKYTLEIDGEFVVVAYDVLEQIIELLERKGTESDENYQIEKDVIVLEGEESEDNGEDVEVYDECNPYK